MDDTNNTNPTSEDNEQAAAAFEAELEAMRQTSETPVSEASANPFDEALAQDEDAPLPDDVAEPDIPDIPDSDTRDDAGPLLSPLDDTPAEDFGSLRSPIRPPVQDAPAAELQPLDDDGDALPEIDENPDDPQAALENIRAKMEVAAAEFSSGKLNRAQFSAIYKHYSEKRTIIEKLIARDPQNEAWKQVAQGGHTTFLRHHFEARPVFYAVFLNDQTKPLMTGGKQLPKAVEQINKLLKAVWNAKNRPDSGDLARKDIGETLWLALAVGTHGVTFVVFAMQPSALQMNRVRDLHRDFERANHLALERGNIAPKKMVFPQRSLIP